MNRALVLLVALAAAALATHASASEAAWRALATPNHIALMRHATAPGVGDPANFELRNCATQRNLSEAGRNEARKLGQLYRDKGMVDARLYSSQWCRCLDTAREMGLGEVTEWPSLNSFFRHGDENAQMKELRAQIAALGLSRPAILVTHQVNITALTGIFPASGETIVLKREDDGSLTEIGRIPPP